VGRLLIKTSKGQTIKFFFMTMDEKKNAFEGLRYLR
jgi:hypothetical protein